MNPENHHTPPQYNEKPREQKVLIVDDKYENRILLGHRIQRIGYHHRLAIDPGEYSSSLAEKHDILVTDVNDTDNVGASIEPCLLRARDFLQAEKPVIFLSGLPSNQKRIDERFQKLYPDKYVFLDKPKINVSLLKKTFESLTERGLIARISVRVSDALDETRQSQDSSA